MSSVTDNAVSTTLNQLYNELPTLQQLLQNQQSNPHDASVPIAIQKLMTKMDQQVASVQSLVDESIRHGEKTYDAVTTPLTKASADSELLAGQQAFETVSHLAEESKQAYLRQRKIMWLWVFLVIVLAGGTVYMYFWIVGLGHGTERTLANPPDRRELFDNKAVSHTDFAEEDDEDANTLVAPEEDDASANIARSTSAQAPSADAGPAAVPPASEGDEDDFFGTSDATGPEENAPTGSRAQSMSVTRSKSRADTGGRRRRT